MFCLLNGDYTLSPKPLRVFGFGVEAGIWQSFTDRPVMQLMLETVISPSKIRSKSCRGMHRGESTNASLVPNPNASRPKPLELAKNGPQQGN